MAADAYPLMKVSEVSNLLVEKPLTTYQKIAKGVFPVGVLVRLGPRCIRFHRKNLTAWLEAGGSKNQA